MGLGLAMECTYVPRFFQIHLSTAVVLAICAGVFIGLNLRLQKERWFLMPLGNPDLLMEIDKTFYDGLLPTSWYNYAYHVRETGWPTAWSTCVLEEQGWFAPVHRSQSAKCTISNRNITINVAVATIILIVTWIGRETWIRRRELQGVPKSSALKEKFYKDLRF
jgi:hypothetical protein